MYMYIYLVYWWDIKKLIIYIFIFIILYFVIHISSAKTNESVINILCKIWLPFYGYGFFISKGVKAKFLQKLILLHEFPIFIFKNILFIIFKIDYFNS